MFWDCTHKKSCINKNRIYLHKKGFSSTKKTKEKKSFSSNGCSGYQIWVPHRRSPVRSLVETLLLFFCFGQFSVINLFKNVSHVLSSQKLQLAIKNAAKIDNNWQKGIINNQFFHLNLPFALCVTREQCGSTEDHFCHVFSL